MRIHLLGWLLMIFVVSVIGFAQTDMPAAADMVLQNGYVYTIDSERSVAQSVAIRGNEIIYVGSNEGANAFIGPATKITDLKGQMVMPGLVDGHVHPLDGGLALNSNSLDYLQLTVAQTRTKLLEFLKLTQAEEPDGWLQVTNWDLQGIKPAGTIPDMEFFKNLPSKRPIILRSDDGHNALVNTRGLKLSKISSKTKNPPGGEIVRDAKGQPTGLLKDTAIDLVTAVIPPLSENNLLSNMRLAVRSLNEVGVTTVFDASGGRDSGKLYKTLLDRKQLTLRVENALVVGDNEIKNPAKTLEQFTAISKKYSGGYLQMGSVKYFLDGVIEYPIQTAAMLKPYLDCDKKGNCKPSKRSGQVYFKASDIAKSFATMDKAGWKIHIHAIGDAAIRAGLDGISAVKKINNGLHARHAITHLELIDPKDIERFAKLDVIANFQLQWAIRNQYTVESLAAYIGPDRMKNLYPARSLRDSGTKMAAGSDWPVDRLNPWTIVETAVTRTAPKGEGYPEALLPEQTLTLEESIAMLTMGSAYQLNLDTQVGSLEVGKRADVIVLNQNLFNVPIETVSETKVLMTIFDGQVVHKHD